MVSGKITTIKHMLTSLGLPSPQPRGRSISRLSSAWESYLPSFQSPFVLDAKTATMTLSLPTFVRPSRFTTPATSCLGTGILPTLMRRHCAMSVATRATSLTTTGRNGQMTRQSRHCLTGRRPPWAAMASLAAQTRQATEFLPMWIR